MFLPYDALPAVDLSVIKDSVSGIDRISDGGAALSAYAKLQYYQYERSGKRGH